MVAALKPTATTLTYYPLGAARAFIACRDPEAVLVGPAGCVAGETRLYDPLTGLHTPIKDLYLAGVAPVVSTLLGPVQATVPFRKGVARLYRITMASGGTCLVTGDHRVLTPLGWRHVDVVQPGDRLLASPRFLPASTEGDDPSTLRRGVAHSERTLQGSPVGCSAGLRPDGGLLRPLSGSGPALSPSRADAPGRSRGGRIVDGQKSSAGHSRPYQSPDRHARMDCSPAPAGPTVDRESGNAPERPSPAGACCQLAERSPKETPPLRQVDGRDRAVASSDFARSYATAQRPAASRLLLRDEPGSPTPVLSLSSFGSAHTTRRSDLPALGSDGYSPSLSTSYPYYTAQWDTVSTLEYERTDEYFDLHVPDAEHYLAEGLWHHNTGKTMSLAHKLHLSARKYPGCRILLCRKTLESLKTGALNTYLKHVQPRLDGVQEFGGNKFYPAEFRYPNGSVIVVGGLDKADKVMSAEFDLIAVNEATEITEDDWQALKTRLRNGLMPYQQLLGDCNPSGARHWLKLRIDSGATRGFTSTHQDNPAYWDRRRGEWTDMGRRYVAENLASLTGARRKRLLDGQWAAAEGLVYDDFTPAMVRPMDTEGWRVVLGVDVGSKNPTAILTCHIAGDGRWHVSREVYRREMTATDILQAIREEARRSGAHRIYIDPSAKAYIDQLDKERLPVVKAVNDILVGIQRVQGVLQAGFTIDPTCTNTVEEFGMYAYPDGNRTETDKPIDDFNHAEDALRYAVMGEMTPRKSRGFLTS